MPRVRKGAARRQSKKRILKDVKGYRGSRSKNWRLVQEARVRAGCNAFKDRRRLNAISAAFGSRALAPPVTAGTYATASSFSV